MPNISGWWTPITPCVDVYLNDRLYSLTSHWLELDRAPIRCFGNDCCLCAADYPSRTEFIAPIRHPESTIVALLRLPKSLMTDPAVVSLRALGPEADGVLLKLIDWFTEPKIEVIYAEKQTIPHPRCDRYIAAIGVARYLRLQREQTLCR